MKSERTDLLVGAMMVGAVVLTGVIAFWLWPSLGSTEYRIYTRFDSVEGITPQAPVYVRGYQVGQVDRIEPQTAPDGSLAFRVRMTFQGELASGELLRVPSGSKAYLTPPQIPIGSGAIVLELPPGRSRPLATGSTIPGLRRPAAMDDAKLVMTTLSGELAQTLLTARTMMTAAATAATSLDQTVAGANSALPLLVGGLDRELAAVEALTRSMDAEFARLGPSAATSLDTLVSLLSDSRELVQRLSHLTATTTPQVAGIMARLDSTSATLDEFTRQLSERPMGVLFRGVRPAAPVPSSAPAGGNADAPLANDTSGEVPEAAESVVP